MSVVISLPEASFLANLSLRWSGSFSLYLIECIRKALGLQDLPYIFDECDKLDNNSLANLDTDSQIITTMVDDENYKEITLISR